tara:strand:- start:938 stop:1339 length:402 start_codon:yes stop_codon:yes gene_type:complete
LSKSTNIYKSEKQFGYLLSFFLLALGSYICFLKNSSIGVTVLVLSFLTFLLALLRPSNLTFYTTAWIKFGTLIGKVFSPIILGFLYFGIFTPVSVFFKALGRDELNLKKSEVQSYWIKRDSTQIKADSFKNQF